jgi:hypothetical protein
MKHLNLNPLRTAWLATVVVVVAGIAAGAAQGSYGPRFKEPKLKDGVLIVTGTKASEKIALRLQAGVPGTLQVDVGDDGSPDFSFDRARSRRSPSTRGRATMSCASTKATASSPTRLRRRSTVATEATRSPAARATRR